METIPNEPTAGPGTALDRPPDPMQIIAEFTAKGGDAATIATLCSLQERWEKRQAENAFNVAMAECQRELQSNPVVRDAVNSQTSSKYAKLERVSKTIDPIIHKHGFSLMYGTDEPKGEKTIRVVLDILHKAGHVKRIFGDFGLDDSGIKGSVNKTPIQATGSTYSYARRYLKLMGFDVPMAGEDDDGQGSSAEEVTPAMLGELEGLLAALKSSGTIPNWGDYEARFWRWLTTVARVKVERTDDVNFTAWCLATQQLKQQLPKKKE